MTYIFVFFIPGAAGNFFTRALNLLDGAVAWKRFGGEIPITMEEKLQVLNYLPVMHKEFNDRNWVSDWERKVVNYGGFENLPKDTKYGVWMSHPNYGFFTKDLAGEDDRVFSFYIDPSDCFEWCILNALYKNSYLEVGWLKTGEQMRKDNNIHNISLQNIIAGENKFLEEFKKVCDTVGHNLTEQETESIKILYNQWKITTLTPDRFDEFKQAIGFHM